VREPAGRRSNSDIARFLLVGGAYYVTAWLSLRIALGATGDYRRLNEHLSLAEQDAILINDRQRLGAICIARTHVHNMLGDIEEAISNGCAAQRDSSCDSRSSHLE